VVLKKLNIMLVHELVDVVAKWAKKEKLFEEAGMEPRTREHLQRVKAELGEPELLGLGLWLDGVPFNWDRSQSVEVISINFPGLTGEWKNLRLPICAIPKDFVATGETFDDILEIVLWSLEHLAVGTNPSTRQDGEPWTPADKDRRAKAGKPLRVKAVLVEVRGDWLMMKEVFHLPGWKDKGGCCWLCSATPGTFRDAGQSAKWREERLSHWELLERMVAAGHVPSPLMSAPGVRSHIFKIDWLHAMDQGVAADYVGNLLNMLLRKMEGRNMKKRLQALHMEIKCFYEEKGVESRLQTLTRGMIQKKTAPPKLRAKAAEVRDLIPFTKIAADKFLDSSKPTEEAAKKMAHHLVELYGTLSSAAENRAEVMRENSRKFCILYSGLEKHFAGTKLWRIKPKFHLMQELCEMTEGANPAAAWTYRDEDFGGSVAKMTRRRGGKNTAISVSRNMISKWCAKHDVPIIA
jgi:hypothetical protein